VLQVPSGREVYVHICCLYMLDAQKHTVGTVYVFHDITHFYKKALHLQRVHHAMLTLREAIAHIPEHLDFASPEGSFLLSPPVLFVAQQIVDVIGQVLDCQYVSLWALGPAGYLHYAVGSGFTPEQEHYRQETRGCFLPSDFVDETVLARLSANQEAILPADRLHLPPGFQKDLGARKLLLIPMFLEKQLAGALVIAKAGFDSEYAPEEIELVKAVATETALVLACLLYVHEQAEMGARELVRQEMNRLINEFLNLASHELKSSLTVIKGNIQLAQRRLAALKRQVTEQPGQASEKLEQVQQPLEAAVRGARLQERMIKELIDDACIQANTFELHMKRCDLIALLREAVAHQQRSAPERTIILEIMTTEKTVPINADAERILQVINAYLENAFNYAPADQPVTVRLTVEDVVARVSVHDEGPGIPVEEQGHIWERFYHAKGIADHHELDLSLGLGLYLCQVFIERHHGSVGVQSDPGHGTTFWFTLPIEASVHSRPIQAVPPTMAS
ncbi:MAG TPA: GAF domain-containing sensor histidine kinase, partial [Ktedonobacteraceae bacterium]|nr:GAF domain-containing sensor histidine kinase [Ktedonobacteraceae bacterium]